VSDALTEEARRRRRLWRLAVEHAERPRARWPWLVLVAFVLGLLVGARLEAAEPPLRAVAYPKIAFEGGAVHARCWVAEPDQAAALRVAVVDQLGTVRASDVPSAHISRLNELTVEHLPCGHLAVACLLVTIQKTRFEQQDPLEVRGRCSEDGGPR
jgi:hypothetical protein